MEIDQNSDLEQLLHSYHQIKSLEITGGFLDGLKIDFEDGLNCIIGGRGTGKTTIIEFIRFALDKMPDEIFDAGRYESIKKLIENNLGNGTVRLVVKTRDGQILNFERQASSNAPTITDAEGTLLEFETHTSILFNAEIYSQDEIEEIAANPFFQLELIDKFESQKIAEVDSKIRIAKSELKQNAANIAKLKNSISICKEKTATLPEVFQKLKSVQLSNAANTLPLQQEINNHATREKEKACIEGLSAFCQSTHNELEIISSSLMTQLAELFEIENAPNKNLLEEYHRECENAVKNASAHLFEASTIFNSLFTKIPEWQTKLVALHGTQDKKYHELLNQHEKEKARAMERASLLKIYNDLLLHKKQLEKAEIELGGLKTTRQNLLRRLSDLRDERYSLRQKIVNDLNHQLSPSVKIAVEQFGNVEEYEKLLKETLTGSGLQYTRIIPKALKISPETLARLVSAQDTKTLSEKLDLNTEQVAKFIAAFYDKENLYALETAELHDKPSIQLKSGAEYKDSFSLSTGQRCSTILPILLLRSESPLLIDQPENNLDNAFIYNPVVTTLKNLKGSRQCIFVTHNPNIPVIGNAAGVYFMTSDGAHGKIEKHGNVDSLKNEIAALLEGGEEAFKTRYKLYGY